jgi:hypothetical protein
MFYDRTVSAHLLDALDDGGVLHGLVTRARQNRRLLDLQLRGYPGQRECKVSLYVGLTTVLDVTAHVDRGFRMTVHKTHAAAGGFDPAWRAWHSGEALKALWPDVEQYLDRVISAVHPRHIHREGQLHALLCSGDLAQFAVIDREAVVCFSNESEKQAVLGRLTTPYRDAIARVDSAGAWWLKRLALGSGCDLLALDSQERLLVIEAKFAGATGEIPWAPAQVGVYADLFREWTNADSNSGAVLARMLEQRVRLGLSPDLGVSLREPLDIIPVVAIGGEVRSKVALGRLATVQRTLMAAQVGWPNLEVWIVDPKLPAMIALHNALP